MLIQMLPEYLSYYQKGFHPTDIDYSKIVLYWKERLAKDYQVESFKSELQSILYS